MPDQDPVIRTENLFKTYSENGVPTHAVRGVSFEINRGEFTAIVGPSGSGKTTLLNIISGLDMPSKGSAWLGGNDISTLSGKALSDYRRDHIGFIFQAYNLIPVLTAEENIEYIMLLQGVEKKQRHERVLSILRDVGLEG